MFSSSIGFALGGLWGSGRTWGYEEDGAGPTRDGDRPTGAASVDRAGMVIGKGCGDFGRPGSEGTIDLDEVRAGT